MTFDSMMALAAFAAAMTGTPGPANLSLMASGAAVGFARSALFLIGVWLGFCAVLAATAAGLGALLAASPALYAGLKIAGFAYICILAVQIFRMMPASGSQTADARRFGWLDGAIIHPLNPKAYMTALGAFTVFVPAGPDYVRDVMSASAIILLIGIPLNCLWCASGGLLHRFLQNPTWRPFVLGSLSLAMVTSVGWSMLA